MPVLVKIDLLFVKIAPQIKKIMLEKGYFSGPQKNKVPKITKKLSFHENGYGIQKNDPTIIIIINHTCQIVQ